MNYKEYVGYVTYDSKGKYFFREVIGLNDGITFQGTTGKELETALRDSVEVYLAWCAERGVDPEKTYSGKLRLRMKPSLHKELSLCAAKKEISLNRYINEALSQAVNSASKEEERGGITRESALLALSV